MSSHHIVRDDQEPALIIANGEACSMDLLNQLLEWSPHIVVLDRAIERVLTLGIKVDVLIGDFDRDFDYKKYESQQFPPIKVIKVDDLNSTDLDKAYQYLIDHKFPAANVVWATGRRADHTMSNLTNLVQVKEKLQVVVLDDYSKVYLCPTSFKKWYPEGTSLSLIPVGTASGITTKNLVYPLQNEALTLGYRSGSSNEVATDGIVEITYQEGDLLLMECFD